MLSKILNFMKRSGVVYVLATGRDFQGQEMMDSLNPLDEVILHSEYPLSEIYRYPFGWGLLNGIFNTYHVLVGNHYDFFLKGHGRKGILDLLLFPLIGRILLAFSFDPNHHMALRVPAFLIGVLLEIPRGLIGIVLTLGLIPLVTLVHGLTYFKAQRYKKDSHALEVIRKDEILIDQPDGEFKKEIHVEKTTLGALQQHFEVIHPIYKPIFAKPSAEEKQVLQRNEKLSHFVTYKNVRLPTGGTRTLDYMVELKKKNKEGIKALLAMNFMSILDKLKEKPGALEELEQWIKQSPEEAAREAFLQGTIGRTGEAPSAIKKMVKDPLFDKNILNMVFYMADMAPDDYCDKTTETEDVVIDIGCRV